MIYYVAVTISIALCIIINSFYRYPRSNHVAFVRGTLRVSRYSFQRSCIFFLAALPLFSLSALRYGIGTDYFYGYVPCFEEIVSGTLGNHSSSLEEGFLFLNYVIAIFSHDYQWMFVITSAIFVFLAFKTIKDRSKNAVLSVLILFLSYEYLRSYNTVRQSLASVIALVALPWAYSKEQKDKIKFIVSIIIATSIHKFAMVYLVFLFVPRFNVSFLVISVLTGLIALLRENLSKIIQFFLIGIERYEYYFNISVVSRSTSYYVMLANIVLLFILLYIEKRNRELANNKEWIVTKWLQYFVILLLPFDGLIPNAGRVELFFMFPQFLTITNAVEAHKYKREKIGLTAIVLFVYLSEYLFYFYTGYGEVFPYTSIFSR